MQCSSRVIGSVAVCPMIAALLRPRLKALIFQRDLLTRSDRQRAAAAEPQSDEILESDAAWRATTWQRLFPLALVVPGATRLHGRSTEVDWVDL